MPSIPPHPLPPFHRRAATARPGTGHRSARGPESERSLCQAMPGGSVPAGKSAGHHRSFHFIDFKRSVPLGRALQWRSGQLECPSLPHCQRRARWEWIDGCILASRSAGDGLKRSVSEQLFSVTTRLTLGEARQRCPPPLFIHFHVSSCPDLGPL